MSEGASKILVYIDSHPGSSSLIRIASKKAETHKCSFEVIYGEIHNDNTLYRESSRRLDYFLESARKLGGSIRRIDITNISKSVSDIIAESKENKVNILTLIVGNPVKKTFIDKFKYSSIQKLTKLSESLLIEIQIIPLQGINHHPSIFEKFYINQLKPKSLSFAVIVFFISLNLVFIIQKMLFSFSANAKNTIAMMVFVVSSMLTSAKSGLIPGLISTGLGFLTISYFYIDPNILPGVKNIDYSVDLYSFLICSIATILIGSFKTGQSDIVVKRKKRVQAFYEIYRQAIEAKNKVEALKILHTQLRNLFSDDIAFYLPDESSKLKLAYPEDIKLTHEENEMLEESWKEHEAIGFGTTKKYLSNWRFEPMSTVRSDIGIIAFNVTKDYKLDPSFNTNVNSVADQVASIIERINLANEVSLGLIKQEKEKLRSLLLSSISHDLKTPLVSIIGSLGIFKRMKDADKLNKEISEELIKTALDEAERLNRFITNILEMTKIESGEVKLNMEWICPIEFLNQVKRDMKAILNNSACEIQIINEEEYDLSDIEIKIDLVTVTQVMRNVIDNAIKYSLDKRIQIFCKIYQSGFLFSVRDFGPGIEEDRLDKIFDKYERLNKSDNKIAGTGLGLAICKEVIKAHEGWIDAQNHKDGGSVFRIWFKDVRKN